MEVPDSLKKCADVPIKPEGNYMQSDVAKWAVKLFYAHADCKSKHGRVIGILG